jgi:ribonuclease HI
MDAYLLQFDGASEPNPGPSGAAYVLFSPVVKNSNGELVRNVVQEGYMYLPHATNNEAEYSSLILGLTKAYELDIWNLKIEGDSNLVVNQVQGLWKVKVARLIPLHARATELLAHFTHTIKHIPREQNAHADKLSKEAIQMKCEAHRTTSQTPQSTRQ